MGCAVIILDFFFPIKRKQGVNNCFKPLILSVFTTVASRLISEQKGKEKQIPNWIQHHLNYQSLALYEINESFSFSSNN